MALAHDLQHFARCHRDVGARAVDRGNTDFAQGVEILPQKEHLAAMLDRAQIAAPADVIVSKMNMNGTALVGRSFLDDTQQVLYIGLNKRSHGDKAAFDRDVAVELDLMTVGTEFPTIGVEASRAKWMDAAALSQIVKVAPGTNSTASDQIQDRYFHLKLTCGASETECFFAIPEVLQSRKVNFQPV